MEPEIPHAAQEKAARDKLAAPQRKLAVWPWVYNLYMDPKGQRGTGHRYFEWELTAVVGMLNDHAGTYAKSLMKNLGLELPK